MEDYQADIGLAIKIEGLLALRKSKLGKLESTYMKGKRQVENMRAEISRFINEHKKLESDMESQISLLTERYLGGDFQPKDMLLWFSKEKALKNDVVQSKVALKTKKQSLIRLEQLNDEQKKAYQQSILQCEKIKLLKSKLLNE